MRCSFWITGFTLGVLFLVIGCSDSQQYNLPQAAAPKIETGQVYEILKFKTFFDKVKVVLDDSNLAHVFIASSKLKSVNYILVGSQGVVQKQVIKTSVSPYAIDAAFDKAGVLHLLIDDKHFIKKNDQWQSEPRTPWQEAGFKISTCRFVQGGSDLIWSFNVKGSDLDLSGRWDLFGFGGYGAGIIWPWHSQVSKLIFVPETSPSYSRWFVFDINSKSDSVNCKAAANSSGTAYTVYDSQRTVLANVSEPKFAQFACEGRPVGDPNVSADKRRIEAVTGKPIEGPYDRYGLGVQCSIAADPNSDCAIFVKAHSVSWLISNGVCSKAIPLPLETFWEPRVAAAGNQRFHAVLSATAHNQWTGKGFPVLYLEFSEGKWSSPVELGLADVSSMWGMIWDAIAIGSRGENALVTWPMKDGIYGRWIRISK